MEELFAEHGRGLQRGFFRRAQAIDLGCHDAPDRSRHGRSETTGACVTDQLLEKKGVTGGPSDTLFDQRVGGIEKACGEQPRLLVGQLPEFDEHQRGAADERLEDGDRVAFNPRC